MSTVTQEKDYGHVPVLLHECLDALAIKPDGIYVERRRWKKVSA